MVDYVTRIAFNKFEWQRPSGQPNKGNATYTSLNGFGHEEWLFRDSWCLGEDWHYAFLEGVNRSYSRLEREGFPPFNVTLFTVEPSKARRYVAQIDEVECLSPELADWAVQAYKERGWYEQMRAEIAEVGGNQSALGDTKWARHLLNVRFRLRNVLRFPPGISTAVGELATRLSRYHLYKLDRPIGPLRGDKASNKKELPSIESFMRRGTNAVLCSPEHAVMQRNLVQELRTAHPDADIDWEVRGVDVVMLSGDERVLFEIKSDLKPLSVIRQALGQLLEYAFLAESADRKNLRLVIVGRKPLDAAASAYFRLICERFSLPLEHRVVSASSHAIQTTEG